ncbi:HET-s/LopB domain-containing protein [Pleurostoma richardsiae]|uniref:HET-s/LopB domain-containing protein n=1 Tax=Pleurostoma richardsiae TaxID=41990 RepID=A0AA38RCM3_9PEZI|nr:HET-s/LopB domain-containing protein [Pleurostoma richardsiae]
MESYFPLGGFQMPFQRRLSRLYNDTKKSSDFVKEPVQSAEDPEIKALHRKLRIQKDRLVSWGLEWSDSSQSAEIDESLSKAGLSEVVGSIMSTIKDILAEAEPLWLSSKRLIGVSEKEPERPAGDKKIPLVVWDKGRFEDLVRDLTSSIDTLYDLSRTRSSAAMSSQARRLLSKSTTAEDFRAFESTRMQTPQQIEPRTLTNLRDMQAVSMAKPSGQPQAREIVFMSKQAYSELTHHTGRQPYSPLLLEFAEFDPMYSATGIMPSMTRFEKLSSGLQTEPQRSPDSWTGLPRLLGYFEDMEHSRLGLVYQFPPTFNPVSFEHTTQNPLYNLSSLADLLSRPDFEPKLEAKFRLAYNLANTVFDMHTRGIIHGNLVDSNVSFCNAASVEPGATTGEVDIRRPLVSSFDLFPDSFQDGSPAAFSLHRHPLDPRATTALSTNFDSKAFDLYSLAMLLLSVGLWTSLDNLVPNPAANSVPESVLEQLSIRCGSLYMKAVQACWNAADQELAGQTDADQISDEVQMKASRYLEACCILDSVGNLEERLSDDLGEANTSSWSLKVPTGPTSPATNKADMEKATKQSANLQIGQTPALSSIKEALPPARQVTSHVTTPTVSRSEGRYASGPQPKSQSSKLHLYPHIPLSPEAIEQWNSVLMPQIDQALRHFYRKHPESVEISLESIGESPKETRPTVLVVCTSVSKVRVILKRKLGALFDGATGFSLKVCRGKVIRSRKRRSGRSMAKSGDAEELGQTAANGDFQERPQNGASIGAWKGNRHLPPVSFGGLILVDDKPFGMTVHHMLDDPDPDRDDAAEGDLATTMRSGASPGSREPPLPDLYAWYEQHYADQESSEGGSGSEDFACEFSDSDSDGYSESAITSSDDDSDAESDSEMDHFTDAGDIPGIEPGGGANYIVTQPALDDVAEGFYPCEETKNEDHLDTFGLGEVYASSGIRRRMDGNGLVHEIDWALFKFKEERQPGENSMPRVTREQRRNSNSSAGSVGDIYPRTVTPSLSLPGLEVQCMARTSGLQTGVILPTLTSVKIYGRASPSHTYQVSGHLLSSSTSTSTSTSAEAPKPSLCPIGVPGDSGAWVVDRRQGQVCGHVLAWSERKRVAYICPMEVLLLDIAEVLRAAEIRLPGGDAVLRTADVKGEHQAEARLQNRFETPETDEIENDKAERSIEHGRGSADEGYHEEDEDLGDLLEEEADDSEPPRLAMLDKAARLGLLADGMGKMHIGHKEIVGLRGY